MKRNSPPIILPLIVLAGTAMNAHALCVNSDGSLDDKSISPSTIAIDVLPYCEQSPLKAETPPPPEKGQKLATPAIQTSINKKEH